MGIWNLELGNGNGGWGGQAPERRGIQRGWLPSWAWISFRKPNVFQCCWSEVISRMLGLDLSANYFVPFSVLGALFTFLVPTHLHALACASTRLEGQRPAAGLKTVPRVFSSLLTLKWSPP